MCKNSAIFRQLKEFTKLSIQMQTITIKTPAVFSFEECYKFLGRSQNECLYSLESGKIRKLFFVEKLPILVEIQRTNCESLALVFLNGIPTETQISAIKNYIENWLDLKNDLVAFYEMAEYDPLLSPLVKRYRGLRLIGIPGFFEAMSWAIIGQQINLNFAHAVKRNLVERFGERVEFDGQVYYHFPNPEKVLSISKQEFSDLKFSRQKTAYILAIAENIVDGKMNFEQLKELDYTAAKSKLLSFHGVGNWTADYVLMKTFRFPQAFPVQDAGFQNALKNLLKLPAKPDMPTILQLSKSWNGFEAYATFYLWRSLYE